jgi:hypothetical protein
MGAEQALAAMGSDTRIRVVVAEGATGQQPADHGWRPHDVTGIIDRGMEWVQYTAAGLLGGAPRPMSIRDAIRAAAPRPVLIIAGGATADEPVAARWFQAASPANVQLWVVPHAGHTQGLATAASAWEARVIGFLNAALEPQSLIPVTAQTQLRTPKTGVPGGDGGGNRYLTVAGNRELRQPRTRADREACHGEQPEPSAAAART